MREQKIGYVVKSVAVEYHQPAVLDDELQVLTSVESAKRFSMVFLQRVMRDGVELATLHSRLPRSIWRRCVRRPSNRGSRSRWRCSMGFVTIEGTTGVETNTRQIPSLPIASSETTTS
jgi:hypothetical protein